VCRHDPTKWWFITGETAGDAMIVVAAEVLELGGHRRVFRPGRGYGFIFCCNEDDWMGYHYHWASPEYIAWQFGLVGVGPVAVPDDLGPAASARELAALSAFYLMTKTILMKIARDLGLDVTADSLFNILAELAMFILGCDWERAVEIVSVRCTQAPHDVATIELDLCDGADEVLDKDERADVAAAKLKAEKRRAQKHDLRTEVKKAREQIQKRKAAAAAKAAAKAKGKGKGKGRGKGIAPPAPPRLPARVLPPNGAVTQQQAKQLLPPSSYIWRSWRYGMWIGRYPPYKPHSRTWRSHGHYQSCVLVVQQVWTDYLFHHGLDHSSCTVPGLLT